MSEHIELSKVREYNNSVSNNLDGQDYTIEADAEFFTHLSKRIYTDSILAIVRELTCNAWDSQVEAGNCNTPIIIHSPNLLEPVFKVIDYGIGMDLETLKSVYSSYGKSTKRSNMNVTGGLGVGSKTPFSYTDSFTVYSVKDGIQHTMVNYKEKGIPKIKEIFSVPTDEPNGVRIEMPVKVGDFESFEKRIKAISTIFHGNVKVTGIKEYNFADNNIYQNSKLMDKFTVLGLDLPDNLFSIAQWRVNSFTSSNWLVLMGNVPYQLDVNKLDLPDDVKRFINNDLTRGGSVTCLEVPVGMLDFSMSREHLEYSARTKKILNDTLSNIRQTVVDHGELELNQCTNDYQRFQCRYKLSRQARTVFNEPDNKLLHAISLNTKRRGLERLISLYSSDAVCKKISTETSIQCEDYKFVVPNSGDWEINVIMYDKRLMKRKKISAICMSNQISIRQGVNIIMHGTKQTLNLVEKIIKRNLGDNITNVKLKCVHLDDIAVQRDAADPLDKIIGRSVNDSNTIITIGDIVKHEDTQHTVWVHRFGRDALWEDTGYIEDFGIAFYKMFCKFSPLMKLFPKKDPTDDKELEHTIQFISVNSTCQRIPKKYPSMMYLPEFIEEYRETIVNALHEFIEQNISKIIYIYTSDTIRKSQQLQFTKRDPSPSRYTMSEFRQSMGYVNTLLNGLNLPNIRQYPTVSKVLRRNQFEDRVIKREQIKQMSQTQYGSMVLSLNDLEDKIKLFKAYSKKRETKYRYSKRAGDTNE